MSATAFLRHRRATAVEYVTALLKSHPKKVAEVLERHALTPGDLANLRGNNEVLTIADELAAEALDEAELDTLEDLNTFTVGERSAVHSPDVRADQFEDELQHPCQETVGVGNMHDGPEAAEALANVGGHTLALPEIDGDIVKGAQYEADQRDALARGTGGAVAPTGDPAVMPSTEPARDEETALAATEDGTTDSAIDQAKLEASRTATDERKPTDPEGTQEGVAATPVDTVAAAEEVAAQQAAGDKLEVKGEQAINRMGRDELVDYASRIGAEIHPLKPTTPLPTIRKRILEHLEKGSNNG
jgi:hypothetical protein